ncbi:MAG: DNA mismatch repair endonuclease MutL [Gemmatimonadaceae bacterium]
MSDVASAAATLSGVSARVVVLPASVANQIAAGEVVERPASVVKELVENALDAGATRIDVEIEDGGKRLIRVSDDGCGMAREDALLAVARHATSKIRQAADLVGIATFGFRGEALPSIASVSRFELLTAPNEGPATRLAIAGGSADVTVPADSVRQRGTSVTVRDPFFNVPARRKFLRSARGEWRAIADTLTSIALVRRDVHFSVTHDGRAALRLGAASQLRDRVAGLWGSRACERFLDVQDVHGAVLITGLVERPSDVGTASRRAIIFVNGRPVRDLGLIRAAEAAYRSVLPPGVRPSLILEVTLPGDAVDVNVHPAKAEIRLHDRWNVEKGVEAAVRRALGALESAAPLMQWRPDAARAASWGSVPNESAVPSRGAPNGPHTSLFTPLGTPDNAADHAAFPAAASDAFEIVQLRRAYLMYAHDDGIILIDQHSAHERVLYERLLHAFEGGQLPSQRLLFAETLHLAAAELEALEANREAIERTGYAIEDFGGTSVVVNSVPVLHPRFDALRALRDTLAALTGDRVPSAHGRHESLIATLACKAAIKAGDALQREEMNGLVRDLARVRLAPHDVHGRAAIVRLSWDELERKFGRR